MVELRQCRIVPPTAVATVLALARVGPQRPLMHMEPIAIGRAIAVLKQVMKRPKASPAMVEHPIKDQAHAALMQRSNQGIKSLIPPKERIHLEVVVGVIPMIHCRTKDWREVKTGHSQALNVVKSIDHAIQVSPLKTLF